LNTPLERTPGNPSILKFLNMVWRDRRIGWLVALAFSISSGLLVSRLIPRGPATSTQALIGMAGALGIGLLVGLVHPSRWTLLLAPLTHALALELGRIQVAGPTVDAIRLDNTYGILALILGRGFYALVGLLPMILGASYGMAIARRLNPGAGGSIHPAGLARRILGWTPKIALSLTLAGLAVWIAIPASTPAILDEDGKPLPGSIAELATLRIGGHDQALLIRGYSTDNPVLLYLSGGPGQSSLPHPRAIFADMERDFIMVAWDQRGTGKSYAALDPTATLTLDQAVSDTIEVTNYLRQRFDEKKIYLLGESWGTTLGVLAVQRQPELYYAMISSGQMVSQRETDRRLYQDVLALSERTGDAALDKKMRSYGEPPYADVPYAYAFVMDQYDALYQPYTPPQAYLERGEAVNLGPFGVLGSEYNLVEKLNVLRGLIDMFTVMYPQLQEIDFRLDVPRLEVPFYMLDGAAELTARRDLALEWFGMLDAPIKRIFTFQNAAHAVAFEQFQAFHRIMLETIVPETYR
jgi:proline iminopeptidase